MKARVVNRHSLGRRHFYVSQIASRNPHSLRQRAYPQLSARN
jgi:hypothetical protein